MYFCHGNIPLGWGLFWQALLLNGRHIQLDTRRAMTKIRYTLQIGIGEYIDLLAQCCNFYWQPRCAQRVKDDLLFLKLALIFLLGGAHALGIDANYLWADAGRISP